MKNILAIILLSLISSCKTQTTEISMEILDGIWTTKGIKTNGKLEKVPESMYVLVFSRDNLRTNFIQHGKRLSGKYRIDDNKIVILNKGSIFTINKIKRNYMEITQKGSEDSKIIMTKFIDYSK
jgi:hypothetical protein